MFKNMIADSDVIYLFTFAFYPLLAIQSRPSVEINGIVKRGTTPSSPIGNIRDNLQKFKPFSIAPSHMIKK